ncbi:MULTISPECIES: SDR family oxidoreductase [unclassified Sphingomonas]|uniref:SDR family oxidoreductase n=1 Tax=unclassified Sphingomonas TaxID=196159 RepID=UPI0009E90CE8
MSRRSACSDATTPAAQTLVKRVGKTDDIASCVEWLLSDRAGWMTGQTLSPNGGSVLVR